MSKKKPKTIHDVLSTVNVVNARKCEKIATELLELYEDNPKYKESKLELQIELKLVQDYLRIYGNKNGNSTCLC